MDLGKLDKDYLSSLSQEELVDIALCLKRQLEEKSIEAENERQSRKETAELLQAIADDFEQMKLQGRQYYLTKKDPIAVDINDGIARLKAKALSLLNQINGLLHGMKPGSEKSSSKGRPAKVKATELDELDKTDEAKSGKTKKSNPSDTPVNYLNVVMAIQNALDQMAEKKKEVDGLLATLIANRPSPSPTVSKESNKGRRANMAGLPAEEPNWGDVPDNVECPHCKHTAIKRSILEKALKSADTPDSCGTGKSVKFRSHNYLCPHCLKHTCVSEGDDFPIASTRQIGQKPIIHIAFLHYNGVPINRIGRFFESSAKLGSDTVNRMFYEWGRVYMVPLFMAIVDGLKKEPVIVADETTYDVTQPMGYGKMPEDKKKDEKKCNQTYAVSVATPFRALNQLHAYFYMEGRYGYSLVEILKGFGFEAIVADAYKGYDQVAREHPGSKRQVCLVHFRRHMISGAWSVNAVRDFMDLDEARQMEVMKEAQKNDGPFYKEVRIFQAISLIYQWEKEVPKSRGDPEKLSQIRKKQTALMDMVGDLMDKLGDGIVRKSKNGAKWIADDGNPLAQACAFYKNNEKALRCFLSEDNYDIPADSSVVEQNIRPVALLRNNSYFFVNAAHAEVAFATYSVFRTLELNGIDPLKWLTGYCRRLFEHIEARALEQAYYDTGDPAVTRIKVRQEATPGEKDDLPEKEKIYRLSSYAASYDFKGEVDKILAIGRKNRAQSQQ